MIGALIGLYRRVNNLTTKQLAEQIGISPSTLNRVEAGKDCDLDTMLKMIQWLFKAPKKLEQAEMTLEQAERIAGVSTGE